MDYHACWQCLTQALSLQPELPMGPLHHSVPRYSARMLQPVSTMLSWAPSDSQVETSSYGNGQAS